LVLISDEPLDTPLLIRTVGAYQVAEIVLKSRIAETVLFVSTQYRSSFYLYYAYELNAFSRPTLYGWIEYAGGQIFHL